MLYEEDVITEMLPRDLGVLCSQNDYSKDDMKALVADLRYYFGLTYEEYVDIRNGLLIQHNGELSYDDLQQDLINRLTIDLVGRGYLRMSNSAKPLTSSLVMTEKGTDAILRALCSETHIPAEPYQALIYLRNHDLLPT